MSDRTIYWIWLSEVLGPCNARMRELLHEFDYIKEIYDNRQSATLARSLSPVEYKTARTLSLGDCERILNDCESFGARVLCYADESYPERLRQTRIPPAVLYVTGDVAALSGVCVAGVGARNSTKYGRDSVRRLCEPLCRSGITIVSGLAHGIDAEAHRTALKCEAKTVAVLGTAIDDTYPRDHAELRARIESSGGCIASEYPPGTPAHRGMFPRRNRIISGLSRAIIVFEAARRSGTMITANWALDDGREVFAVPGSIFSQNSEGTNRLLKQGAAPATDALDILESIGVAPISEYIQTTLEQTTPSREIKGARKKIYDALADCELDCDALAAKTGLQPGELLAELCELEMDGVVETLPGPKYRRS
ncbi:MAG: DNA-processing protein DprA [Oscillospiraceae bacterium]